MLATVTILLLSWTTAQGTGSQVNSTAISGQPRDCQDLIQQGKTYEGHYVVYPEAAASNKPTMIYCSQADGMQLLPSDKKIPRNCLDHLQAGMTNSGPSIIYPYLENSNDPVIVYCEQEKSGGGWAVIQKRFDGSENFYRGWADYAVGFGNIAAEHYLGNDIIAALTGQSPNELWVDIEAWDGETAYAHYQLFHVGTADINYQLQVSFYDGTAGDALYPYHVGQYFSTYDSDNDANERKNCAEYMHGAWWYKSCYNSNLNGRYYHSADISLEGIRWGSSLGSVSHKSTRMMVRPTFSTAAHTGELHDSRQAGDH